MCHAGGVPPGLEPLTSFDTLLLRPQPESLERQYSPMPCDICAANYSTRWGSEDRVCLSLSLCVCVCLSAIISSELHVQSSSNCFVVVYGRGSVLLWRRSDMLRISGFVDDVIFAYKLIGGSMASPGWGSEAHTYAALSLARRNTRCCQGTLGTTSCSQGLLGRSGRVEYLWHRACT